MDIYPNKIKKKFWSMIRPRIRKNNKKCQSMMPTVISI